MKLCVLAPSQEYLAQAGVRIRYLRIADHLREQGHELTVQVLDQFQSAAQFTHDAYLFSKCYDARCHVIGHMLKNSARLVGVDLFDDYFSQQDNSRFVCHRDWLRSLAGSVDYFLCSTPRMLEVASSFLPNTPGHILNDPFDEANSGTMADVATVNLERALSTRTLEVAWFGVGDNPHFMIGLHDLHAFSPTLALLGRTGLKVKLSILTNRRAITADGLEMLKQLPVMWSLDEWSMSREQSLLANSLVAFIPVNAQPFSIAKSLNRAVSALTAGTQVLSCAYPLYSPLASFVYRTPEALLTDLAQSRLLLRQDTVPALIELLASHGDPAREAQACGDFLTSLLAAKRQQPTSAAPVETVLGLVHGVKSSAVVHKFVQRMRHLSVGSPYCSEQLNYDLRFVPKTEDGGLVAEFSEVARNWVKRDLRDLLVPRSSAPGRAVVGLDVTTLFPILSAVVAKARNGHTRAEQLTNYVSVIGAVRELTRSITEGVETRLSETEAPFTAGLESSSAHSAGCADWSGAG